jgi:endonuclease III
MSICTCTTDQTITSNTEGNDMAIATFWNQEREIYQVSIDGVLVAETTDTKTSMKFHTLKNEVNTLDHHLQLAKNKFASMLEYYKPKDS